MSSRKIISVADQWFGICYSKFANKSYVMHRFFVHCAVVPGRFLGYRMPFALDAEFHNHPCRTGSEMNVKSKKNTGVCHNKQPKKMLRGVWGLPKYYW